MKKEIIYARRIRIHLQGNKFFFFLNFNSEPQKIKSCFLYVTIVYSQMSCHFIVIMFCNLVYM